MEFLLFILFGLVIGVVAKFLMPGRDPGGVIVTALIGMVGSLIGGFLGRMLGMYTEGNRTGGWVMSIIGALVLLGMYRMIVGRRAAA